MKKTVFIFILLCGYCQLALTEHVDIHFDSGLPQAVFAADEIKKALAGKGATVTLTGLSGFDRGSNIKVILASANNAAVVSALTAQGGSTSGLSTLSAQGYALRTTSGSKTHYWGLGGGKAGSQYAGLQLAENFRFHGLVGEYNEDQEPHITQRGIKFNMAMDKVLPAFDSDGDQDKKNVADVWDLSFWKAYIDDLARYRYNVLSWWVRHPFPSMVKLSDYPNVAMTGIQDGYGNTVNNWNIEKKIAFWQEVMQHAENRSVDTYFITWNIRMDGVDGKYGITEAGSNNTTKDYLRKSVKQMVLTYPHLDGMGVTAGENMPNMTDAAKEVWLRDTYGQGILDAKREDPSRSIRFIHRFWWTNVSDILNQFSDYTDPFDFSFKYARAHMYSSPNIPFEDFLLKELPAGVKSWWNLRNDDIFYYRWGDPRFVRDFILNFSEEKTAGYYMGSDGYTWGRVYSSKTPALQGRLEIEKHWYKFMLWGRLGYNPNLSTAVFKNEMAQRFPSVSSAVLFDAWQNASEVIPQITRFFWRDWDWEWYPEGCKGPGFISVNDFIAGKTMQGSGISSIKDYVAKVMSNQAIVNKSPLDIATQLRQYSNAASSQLALLRSASASRDAELQATLNDIEAMVELGRYYAEKITGATHLALFNKHAQVADKQRAITALQLALQHWQNYARVSSQQYFSQSFSRHHKMDWNALTASVKQDIVLAGGDPNQAPLSVSFAQLKNGDQFAIGHSLNITASVSSAVALTGVELFLNDALVARESNAPYTWNAAQHSVLNSLAEGRYQLTLVAKTPSGARAERKITITVGKPSNCILPWSSPSFTVINQTKLWRSGPIDISCMGSASISLAIEGRGKMENADYLNVYYRLDGGARQTLSANTNAFAKKTVVKTQLSASVLELIIEAATSYTDEIYEVSAISIKEDNSSIAVTGITATPTSLSLKVGESASVNASIQPANASNQALSWRSENTSIASVSAEGQVTSLSAGTTMLTATSAEGGFNAQIALTVSAVTDICDIPWSGPELSVTNRALNWSSGPINISCAASVNLSVSAAGLGPMENEDFIKLYYAVDGGTKTTLSEFNNAFAERVLRAESITGKRLELFIDAYTSWPDETYTIKGLSVK